MKNWKIGKYYVKHMIDPRRWYAWWLGKFLQKYISYNFCEQVVYRALTCPDCMQAGECLHCGCKIPDKMLVPSDSCDQQNWGPMLNEQDWNKFKQDMGIHLHILRQ